MKPLFFDPNVCRKEMDKDIKEAWKIVSTLEQYYMSNDRSEEVDLYEYRLEAVLLDIKAKIAFILELLGLNSLNYEFQSEFKQFEGKLKDFYMVPLVGDLSSHPLEYLIRYKSTIDMLSGGQIDNERVIAENQQRLERILISTPKILLDRDIEPNNEAQVRKAIYDILIHVFPDTVREIPIAKVSKTYKPDIGVSSLRTAIEYKFADTEKEVKTCLGGIYEDIKGYAGSKDWTFFFAVIYMTASFFTHEQIKAEFALSEVDDNWKPILVTGGGARKPKLKNT